VKKIDQRIADLPAEKLALLLERLGALEDGAPPEVEAPPIRPRRSQGLRPLSFSQERLWFLAQLEPGSSDYNVPVALRLRGTLAATAFVQALDELLRRHEVLRVSFQSKEGRPEQHVASSLHCAHPRVDLQSLPHAVRETEIRRLARSEAARPFDLRQAPLLRVRWLRCGEDEAVLLLTLHHIVCDGWSLHLLVEELMAVYGAFVTGSQSPLPEPRFQYGDFAEWQRERLRGPKLEELLRYWERQLSDAPRELALRRSDAVSRDAAGAAAEETIVLSREVTERLSALGQQEGATRFMVLVALYGALLHAWSGQEDLCIGANAADRGQIEAEHLVGFFVNQVVLRVRPRRRDTFREFLLQARHVVAEAYAHQELPFEKLVEALGREGGRGDSPLFQAKLEHKEADDTPPLRIPGLQISELEPQAVLLRCDLLLTAASSADGVACTMSFDPSRMAPALIREMALDLSNLAERIAEDPDARIDALAADLSRAREQRRGVQRDELELLRAAKLRSTRRRGVQL
jgi:hypothetical protein